MLLQCKGLGNKLRQHLVSFNRAKHIKPSNTGAS